MGQHRPITWAVVLLLALLFSAASAAASDEARYNLASVQTSKQISVAPGGEARTAIYFYNVDGNRTTHLSLRVSQAPAGWEVSVEPAERSLLVNAGGQMVEIVQNLHVEPSPLLAEPATDIPDGAVSIAVGARGYAVGKIAQVIVRAPESAQPGERGEIQLSADASWPGQSGAAAIRQGRDFDFVAEVIPGEGTVSLALPGAGEPTPDSSGQIVPGEQGADLASFFDRWMPTILALVIVVIGSIVIPTLTARKVRGRGDGK